MKLCAFDIETTGTNEGNDQILEIGALVFDSETGDTLGEFERIIHWDSLRGNPYALAMNSRLIERIAMKEGTTPIYDALQDLSAFLSDNFLEGEELPIAVGFNVGSFDLAFLKKARKEIGWSTREHFHYRTVELGSMLMAYAGSPGPVSSKKAVKLLDASREVAHTALQDCRDARDLYMLGRNKR